MRLRLVYKRSFWNQSIVNEVYCSSLLFHYLDLTLSELLKLIQSVLLPFGIYIINGDHHKFLILILMLKNPFTHFGALPLFF